ncbi:3-hydroxyacyl-CoA dehydrogenase family protein [Ferviditalea candida]|uniref:3-hydroxyacyl-CoA dehydrogenase family protein n=1 Tax=Ferviditalea candida TaxID=3108399 RepID=A0ABU5ZCA9_9BACL|nr:3-hydroxyacyl-CoA dehydrogenase family protein [Paenibacillaceae bacterium T2]
MTNNLRVAILGRNALARTMHSLFSAVPNIEIHGITESSQGRFDAVIETTNLNLEQKREDLMLIERCVEDDTLILSSILGVTATQTASWLMHPYRLVGFAAFAKQDSSELIEIAPGLQTDTSYLERASQLIAYLGKDTETVGDEAGLVFPRILSMIVNEAAFAWTEKMASKEDIDTAMRKGTNYPMGPLEWADQVGLDDIYAVLSGLHRDLGEDRYRPAPILRKMVQAGWLGIQAGKGFYSYE